MFEVFKLETNRFENLSLIDALELWSIQCKPTKSILNLIRKCYQSVQDLTKFTMFDMIFTASNKYSSQFDWILCDFSAFNSEFIFESCLKCGYKEFTQTNKLNRIKLKNSSITNLKDEVNPENKEIKEKITNHGYTESLESLGSKGSIGLKILKTKTKIAILNNRTNNGNNLT